MNTLITGAGTGLGARLAERAIYRSHKVVGVDRSWPTPHDEILQLTSDLGDLEAIPELAAQIAAQGMYTTLIHNAAISATGRFEDIPLDAHQKVMDVNLKAPMLLTNQLLKRDVLPPGSVIVFIASLSVRVGYPGAASYAASKAVLANYAKSLRRALRPRGIHVMPVFPGPMRTDQAARHAPPDAKEGSRMDPDAVARNLWFAIDRRLHEFTPGTANQIFGGLSRAAPNFFDKMMRKIIYDKLDQSVYESDEKDQ